MQSRRPAMVVAVVMALLLLSPTIALARTPPATSWTLAASLHGSNNVPPADPDGFGYARVTFTPSTGQVCWNISVSNIATATASHIHAGAAGTNGPVVIPFTAPNNDGMAHSCAIADK